MSCDMKVQFWVMDPKKEPVMALELLQQNVAFSFNLEVHADGHMTFNILDKKEGKPSVTVSKLGTRPKPENATEEDEPMRNFGLDMHKIHGLMLKFKPTLLENMNNLMAKYGEDLIFPRTLFGGLFDSNLNSATYKFHESYLEMELEPTYVPPKYDETTEPRMIFEKFSPIAAPTIDEQDYTFKETISDSDQTVHTRIRDVTITEIFNNQIQIFGEVPLILSK